MRHTSAFFPDLSSGAESHSYKSWDQCKSCLFLPCRRENRGKHIIRKMPWKGLQASEQPIDIAWICKMTYELSYLCFITNRWLVLLACALKHASAKCAFMPAQLLERHQEKCHLVIQPPNHLLIALQLLGTILQIAFKGCIFLLGDMQHQGPLRLRHSFKCLAMLESVCEAVWWWTNMDWGRCLGKHPEKVCTKEAEDIVSLSTTSLVEIKDRISIFLPTCSDCENYPNSIQQLIFQFMNWSALHSRHPKIRLISLRIETCNNPPHLPSMQCGVWSLCDRSFYLKTKDIQLGKSIKIESIKVVAELTCKDLCFCWRPVRDWQSRLCASFAQSRALTLFSSSSSCLSITTCFLFAFSFARRRSS